MELMTILKTHDRIEREALEAIAVARAELQQERERIFARFGGAVRFSDDRPSGTPDPDAKIAGAMDELLLAEQEYIARVTPHREALEEIARVGRAVCNLPEPYREVFLSLYFDGGELALPEWRVTQLRAEGFLILQKLLYTSCAGCQTVIK